MKANNSSSNHSCPLVSVVMACHNNELDIKETLESLVNQCYKNIEIIIIDDCSKDNTFSIVKNFLTSHNASYTIIQNTKNVGLTKSLIYGCDIAKGKYIARHDAGDTSSPNRLTDQVSFLEKNKNYGLVFTMLELCESKFKKPLLVHDKKNHECLDVKNKQYIECPSHHGSAMFATSVYKLAGGYRHQFYYAQDLDLWLRIRLHTNYKILDKAKYTANFSATDISGVARIEQQKLKELSIQSLTNPSNSSLILAQAANIRPIKNNITIYQKCNNYCKRTINEIRTNYFIASCLINKHYYEEARHYLIKTVPYGLSQPKYVIKYFKTFFH